MPDAVDELVDREHVGAIRVELWSYKFVASTNKSPATDQDFAQNLIEDKTQGGATRHQSQQEDSGGLNSTNHR